MKLSCTTSDFLQALQVVSRAVGVQQALPILSNILIHVEGKRCTLSATDLEISTISSFEAQVENEGSITIPAKALLNFVQYNNDGEILLETSEGTLLKCSSAHAKSTLSGEAASEYPTITPVERSIAFSLDGVTLLEALSSVTFASARTALRPVLAGVYLRYEQGALVLVATDSYRLSEVRLPVEGVEGAISCIIPTKVLEELRTLLSAKRSAGASKDGVKLEVILSAQQVQFSVGSTHLLSRLIEGKFPDYRQIIPKETGTMATFKTSELTTAVRRMHYFAKEANNSLTIKLTSAGAHIQTPQTPFGRDEATLTSEVTGADVRIALSSSYLLDFLGHIGTDHVEMHVQDGVHPATFRRPKDDRFLHLIMPLRLQEE